MLTKFRPKSSDIFVCTHCDYSTSRQSQFDRHVLTAKHQALTKCQHLSTKKVPKSSAGEYVCECGKVYKERSGLWRHKKKCPGSKTVSEMPDKELVIMLINDNKELRNMLVEQTREHLREKDDIKHMMMEVLKNGVQNHTTTITNTNCLNNHQTFNLQFFLNETCKHAMNINEFVETIQVQLSDLERFGEIGYVANLSNIITNNLKALDVTERPVHCTDKKREVIYIKDEDKWEKEDDNKTRLRKAIKKIASKNYRLLPEYREKHPGCQYAESQFSDKYNKMVVEAMGGIGNEDEKEDKIIKNISKNVLIDKGNANI